MTTGVIYARVSSIGDRQSTERQVKDLSEYAKYKGIEVCKVFEEQLTLFDEEGHPSLFAPIIIATLSTCAQLERDNTSFRLQSGRKRYIEKGGKLGRKVGSVKNAIIAIILLVLRSFQRKGLCNSGLKAKSTTFAYNNK